MVPLKNMMGTPLPDSLPASVYMVAVAGTGMGALAVLLRDRGIAVVGSDKAAWPPIGPLLERQGVQMRMPFDAANVPQDAELVVVGNAVGRDHPEVAVLLEQDMPFVSMPEALELYVLPNRPVYVAAGTHGKTTTSAMMAYLLEGLGAEPGYLIGGQPENMDIPGRFGAEGAPFVLEGDEYSSCFYDNGPKFAHYPPTAIVMPSLEFDHADVYRSDKEYLDVFYHWLQAHEEALLCVDSTWPMARKLSARCRNRVLQLGRRKTDQIHFDPLMVQGGSAFNLRVNNVDAGMYRTALYGEHNMRNWALVITMLLEQGYSADAIAPLVPGFAGVEKRQTILWQAPRGHKAVLFDFGHHPSEIEATLQSVHQRFPGVPVHVVFEPRSFSSRRKMHEQGYLHAFRLARTLALAPVFHADAIDPAERLDTAKVAAAYSHGRAYDTMEALRESMLRRVQSDEDEIVVFFSNGDFGGLPQAVANACRQEYEA